MNTNIPFIVILLSLPPKHRATITSNNPLNNCEYPVTTKDGTFFKYFLQMTLYITVQKLAQITSMLPKSNLIWKAFILTTSMDAIPRIAANNLSIENFSSFINKNEKHTNTNTPDCFNSDVEALSIFDNPM